MENVTWIRFKNQSRMWLILITRYHFVFRLQLTSIKLLKVFRFSTVSVILLPGVGIFWVFFVAWILAIKYLLCRHKRFLLYKILKKSARTLVLKSSWRIIECPQVFFDAAYTYSKLDLNPINLLISIVYISADLLINAFAPFLIVLDVHLD